MLGKLLKYDMMALSRVLVPVHIAAFVVGLVAAGCFFGADAMSERAGALASGPMGVEAALISMLFLMGVFCTGTLFAASAVTLFAIVYRFYKNIFTDEGYLTLTLPVGAGAHVASKVIAAAIWLLIDAIVVGLCSYAVSIAPASLSGSFDETIPYFLLVSSYGFSDISAPLAFVLALSNAALSAITVVITAYAAFSIGSALASKHKVAAGIGLFFVLSWLSGLLHSMKSVMFLTSGYSYGTPIGPDAVAVMSSVVSLVVYLVTAIAFYAVCVYVLDRKTNLA